LTEFTQPKELTTTETGEGDADVGWWCSRWLLALRELRLLVVVLTGWLAAMWLGSGWWWCAALLPGGGRSGIGCRDSSSRLLLL
ncbi:hypothetical protein Dimus_018131, partial [Dionaea muscipula]